MVVVTGVTINGEREVLGCAVGDTETEDFWAESSAPSRPRPRRRGADHLGPPRRPQGRLAKCFVGAGWQRCRVHFMRNILAKVPKADAEMVAPALRTIFVQPSAEAVAAQFDRIVATLEPQFPVVAAMLVDARDDLLGFTAFPIEHWRKIWSTNPLERLHREIKRRTDVVGVFPNDAAIERLVTAVIVEQHDEWAVSECRYLSETSMSRLRQSTPALPASKRKRLAS